MDKLWLNTEDDVSRHVTEFVHAAGRAASKDPRKAFESIARRCAEFRVRVLEAKTISLEAWARFYIIVGSDACVVLGIDWDPAPFVQLLLDKHKRYGTRSLRDWMNVGVLSRIDQKVARALNMLESPGDTGGLTGETMLDTVQDIVGYCVIGMHMVKEMRSEL